MEQRSIETASYVKSIADNAERIEKSVDKLSSSVDVFREQQIRDQEQSKQLRRDVDRIAEKTRENREALDQQCQLATKKISDVAEEVATSLKKVGNASETRMQSFENGPFKELKTEFYKLKEQHIKEEGAKGAMAAAKDVKNWIPTSFAAVCYAVYELLVWISKNINFGGP
jgi:lantibiotic modifying enzyme